VTALLLVLATAVSVFAALALGLPSLVSTLLAGYLAFVGNLALVTWALSPFAAVTRNGLLLAETILLVAALAAWVLRGKPVVPLMDARAALRVIAADPVTLAFIAVVCVALGYELFLALVVPPNNWDSLTYHLPRAAAWLQAGGIHWIANAPTARMNEFQPLAEQEVLFFFVAAGSGALYALPQYLAELAILVAVYGASRRLGFDQRSAVCSAALLATFSAFALQATTAQNDLVAASLPVIAACFLLGGGPTEAVLAGAALGIGLGVKLTTILAWPVLAWLVWMGGRRTALRTIAGGVGAFLAVGVWGYVMNVVHTGHVLGHGQGRVDQSVSPSVVTDIHTVLLLVYRTLDLGRLSNPWIAAFAVAGLGAGVVAAWRRRNPAAVALPLLAPALVLGVAPLLAWITRIAHVPVHDAIYGFSINRDSNEDLSAFGAVGALALIAAPILAFSARRRDRRQLALALALPSFVILLGFYAKYNIWLTRFLIVPAALTAPLFGRLVRRRAATAAVLAVAATSVGLILVHDASKPLNGLAGRPWQLNQAAALRENPATVTGGRAAVALVAYDRRVPATACVGAVLDPDEWSYQLWGPRFQHRVFFLPSLAAVATAVKENLDYVVVSSGVNAPVAGLFKAAGWKTVLLGDYWTLALAPHPNGRCET
jgi:Glycosyltransferase family 87